MGTNLTRREVISQLKRGSRIVTETAAFTFTPERHGGKITLLSLAGGYTATLPPATGSGIVYRVHIGIVSTTGYVINVNPTTDNYEGNVVNIDTDSVDNEATGFVSTGSDDNRFTMNGTTQGGLTIGDWVEFLDAADTVWHVRGQLSGSGSIATSFSNV